MFHLGFILYGTLWASLTWVAISFPILGKFFYYYLLKIYFLMPFPFVFFWDPCNSNVGCLMLSQRCLRPSSLLLILFSFMVFCFSYFHQCIFQLTHLFFCLSYSTVGSLQFTFNLSYSLFIIVYSLIHLGPR